MVKWKIFYTKQALKDAKLLVKSRIKKKTEYLLSVLDEDPFKKSPAYEKLVGDLEGVYSRRINIRQRLIYQVIKKKKSVKVIRMWTHYE